MKIDFANLKKQYNFIENDILNEIKEVLESAQFILGEKVEELEEKLRKFCGAKFCLGTSSGTDSLLLSLMAINIQPGDEIITTPFTFIATAEVISLLKATPVFVDIEEKSFNIDPALIEKNITPKTKAIIAVNLFGQPADFDEINLIGKKYNLTIIEDAAQSFGAEYKDKKSCNLGDIGCTSFFPAKPLGCYGDGGAIFTNKKEIYTKLKSLRIHGQIKRYHHKYIGINGRLDALQAAILLAKLKHYKKEITMRQQVAEKYTKLLTQNSKVRTPCLKEDRNSVWAQYSILTDKRDSLRNYLSKKGIPTAIHYPIPLHLQECFKYLNYKEGDFPVAEKVSKQILSLPMNPYLTDEEIEYICNEIINFFN